jgi:hypothetical protein
LKKEIKKRIEIMEHKGWVGSHDWKRSTDVVDGYPSFNERGKTETQDLDDIIVWQTETQDLDDIIVWLEYGKTSGYIAARQSKKQEEHWAGLIRNILCEKLIKELIIFDDNSFECKCCVCDAVIKGWVHDEETCEPTINCTFCEHLYLRENDIYQYIFHKHKEQL